MVCGRWLGLAGAAASASEWLRMDGARTPPCGGRGVDWLEPRGDRFADRGEDQFSDMMAR